MSLLVPHRVSHAYGNDDVVKELSLELREGETGCLHGASGCGKTNVLRLVAGFETSRRGKILRCDEAVAAPGRHVPPEKRRIGLVFHDDALCLHLTVAGNVGFGIDKKSAQAGRRVLKTLGIALAVAALLTLVVVLALRCHVFLARAQMMRYKKFTSERSSAP